MDKRANGQPIIKVEFRPADQRAFVDMLLELNWASGRLVCEYTFCLTPEMATKGPRRSSAIETRAQACVRAVDGDAACCRRVRCAWLPGHR